MMFLLLLWVYVTEEIWRKPKPNVGMKLCPVVDLYCQNTTKEHTEKSSK